MRTNGRSRPVSLRRWLWPALGGALVLLLFGGAGTAPRAAAQAPPPQRVEAPGSATLAPGEAVLFEYFIPCPPLVMLPGMPPIQASCGCCGPRQLPVINESDGSADVAYDRTTLTITAPAVSTPRLLDLSSAMACKVDPEAANVLRCTIPNPRFVMVVFTTSTPNVQQATVAPGDTAGFVLPLRTAVGNASERRVDVLSHADQPLDLSWDSETLTVAAPAGFEVRMLAAGNGYPPICPAVEGQPNAVVCSTTGLPNTTFTVATVAVDPSRLTAAQVTYTAGWNLVAGPSGTVLSEPCAALPFPCPPIPPDATTTAGPLYTHTAGDTDYRLIYSGTPLEGGIGYWVYFHTTVQATLPAGSPQQITRPLPAGEPVMIGNPGNTTATVTGADAVYTYAASTGYRLTTTLQPGQGAWAFSRDGGAVTIANAAR